MPTTSPFRMTPSLGPDLFQVVKAGQSWYDKLGSPQPGDTAFGDDGREYLWVQATGTIAVAAAPGTQVSVTVNATDPRATVAAGAGGFYAPNSSYYTGTLVAGDRFWVAKGTAP